MALGHGWNDATALGEIWLERFGGVQWTVLPVARAGEFRTPA
jgi:hypothetical protein